MEREMDDGPEDMKAPPARSRSGGLALVVTVAGLGLCLYLLADSRREILYWIAGGAPVELGGPGQFNLEQVGNDVPARIRGAAGMGVVRFARGDELVAIPGTPVMVRRAGGGRGHTAGPPDRREFEAAGRLVRDDTARELWPAFEALVKAGEAIPEDGRLYMLVDGELPRTGWKTPAMTLGLSGMVALNVRSLLRFLRARRR